MPRRNKAEAIKEPVVHVFGPPFLHPQYADCLLHVIHKPKGDEVVKLPDRFILAHRSALAQVGYFEARFLAESPLLVSEHTAVASGAHDPWRGIPLVVHVPHKSSLYSRKISVPTQVAGLPSYYGVYEVCVPFDPSALVRIVANAYRVSKRYHLFGTSGNRGCNEPFVIDAAGAGGDNDAQHTKTTATTLSGKSSLTIAGDGFPEWGTYNEFSWDAPRSAIRDALDDRTATERLLEAVAFAETSIFLGVPQRDTYGGMMRKAMASALEMRAAHAFTRSMDALKPASFPHGAFATEDDYERAHERGGHVDPKLARGNRGPLGFILCAILGSHMFPRSVKEAAVQRCWFLLHEDEQETVRKVDDGIVASVVGGALPCYRPTFAIYGPSPAGSDSISVADDLSKSDPANTGAGTMAPFSLGMDLITNRIYRRENESCDAPARVSRWTRAGGLDWSFYIYRDTLTIECCHPSAPNGGDGDGSGGADGSADDSQANPEEEPSETQRLFARVRVWAHHPFAGRAALATPHYMGWGLFEAHQGSMTPQQENDQARVLAHGVFALPGAPSPHGDIGVTCLGVTLPQAYCTERRLLAYEIEVEPVAEPIVEPHHVDALREANRQLYVDAGLGDLIGIYRENDPEYADSDQESQSS